MGRQKRSRSSSVSSDRDRKRPRRETGDVESAESRRKNREENRKRSAREFFDTHKNEEWFREKYHPDTRSQYLEDVRSLAATNAEKFANDLEANVFDFTLDSEDLGGRDLLSSSKLAAFTKDIVNRHPFTIYIRSVPPSLSRKEVRKAMESAGTVVNFVLSPPVKRWGYARMGWATYERAEDCLSALVHVDGTKVNGTPLSLGVNKPPATIPPIKRTPAAATDRISQDLEVAKNLIRALDEEKGIAALDLSLTKITQKRKQLDVCILYLRLVHCYCFYCAEEFDDCEELNRRCGPIHVRGNPADDRRRHHDSDSGSDNDTEGWVAKIEAANTSRAEGKRGHTASLAPSEAAKEKMLEEVVLPQYTNKVGENKFKCAATDCKKAFAAPAFLHKHIRNKHAGLVAQDMEKAQDRLMEEQFFLNFVADPLHEMMVVPSMPSQASMEYSRAGLMGREPKRGGRGRGRGSGRGARPYVRSSPPARVKSDPRQPIDYVDLHASGDVPEGFDYRRGY